MNEEHLLFDLIQFIYGSFSKKKKKKKKDKPKSAKMSKLI